MSPVAKPFNGPKLPCSAASRATALAADYPADTNCPSTPRNAAARGLQVSRATCCRICFSSENSATKPLGREFSFSSCLSRFSRLDFQPAVLLRPPK